MEGGMWCRIEVMMLVYVIMSRMRCAFTTWVYLLCL